MCARSPLCMSVAGGRFFHECCGCTFLCLSVCLLSVLRVYLPLSICLSCGCAFFCLSVCLAGARSFFYLSVNACMHNTCGSGTGRGPGGRARARRRDYARAPSCAGWSRARSCAQSRPSRPRHVAASPTHAQPPPWLLVASAF